MERRIVYAAIIGLLFFTLPNAVQADTLDDTTATPSPRTVVVLAQSFVAGQSALLAQDDSQKTPETPSVEDGAEAPAVENQIIVTYKPGQSPHQLRKKHDDRVAYQNSFIGAIVLFFRSLIDTIQNNPLPANQINRIEEAEKNAGVEIVERTVEAPDMDESETYLLTLNKSSSVEQAISIFTELPEVDNAQPNYEYTIQ